MPLLIDQDLIHTKIRGVCSDSKNTNIKIQHILNNMYSHPELVDMIFLEHLRDPTTGQIASATRTLSYYTGNVLIKWAGNENLKPGIYQIGKILDKYLNVNWKLFICSWNITGYGKTYKANINQIISGSPQTEEKFVNLGCNLKIQINHI